MISSPLAAKLGMKVLPGLPLATEPVYPMTGFLSKRENLTYTGLAGTVCSWTQKNAEFASRQNRSRNSGDPSRNPETFVTGLTAGVVLVSRRPSGEKRG